MLDMLNRDLVNFVFVMFSVIIGLCVIGICVHFFSTEPTKICTESGTNSTTPGSIARNCIIISGVDGPVKADQLVSAIEALKK